MPLRSERFASVKFSDLGVRLTDEEELRRKQNHINDLKLQCPNAIRLTGSCLVTKLLSSPEGVFLEFWLQEIPQLSLPIARPGVGPRRQVADDQFANDLTRMRNDIAHIRTIIETAIHPAIPLQALRQAGETGERIRGLRMRLRQRDLLQIPDGDVTRPQVVFPNQMYLAPAAVVHISAKPLLMAKEAVELSELEILAPIPEAMIGIALPARMVMTRPSSINCPKVARDFLLQMDSRGRVALKASVVFSWVDGSPAALTFLNFI